MNIYYLKKSERKKGRNRKKGGNTCAHAKRGNRRKVKMATRGQKWLGVGVACPLKGPDLKTNTLKLEL